MYVKFCGYHLTDQITRNKMISKHKRVEEKQISKKKNRKNFFKKLDFKERMTATIYTH